MPLEYEITLAGIENDDCEQCEAFNGTFVVTRQSSARSSPSMAKYCWYNYLFPAETACVPGLRPELILSFYGIGTTYGELTVVIYNVGIFWNLVDDESIFACNTEQDLPPGEPPNTNCDFYPSSTCHIAPYVPE
jgi:hypothetical protein